jgi:hypothetical protein
MSETEKIGDGELEQEANKIQSIFNDAARDYSPKLEWSGMSLAQDTNEQQFVMEAERYVDSHGLDAIRDAGWAIQYIEAHNHEYDDNVVVGIMLPVRGGRMDANQANKDD